MQTILSEYKTHCESVGDIDEHLPTLAKYASECESVIELGVRGCVSSWAFCKGLAENGKDIKKIFSMIFRHATLISCWAYVLKLELTQLISG